MITYAIEGLCCPTGIEMNQMNMTVGFFFSFFLDMPCIADSDKFGCLALGRRGRVKGMRVRCPGFSRWPAIKTRALWRDLLLFMNISGCRRRPAGVFFFGAAPLFSPVRLCILVSIDSRVCIDISFLLIKS